MQLKMTKVEKRLLVVMLLVAFFWTQRHEISDFISGVKSGFSATTEAHRQTKR